MKVMKEIGLLMKNLLKYIYYGKRNLFKIGKTGRPLDLFYNTSNLIIYPTGTYRLLAKWHELSNRLGLSIYLCKLMSIGIYCLKLSIIHF